MDALNPLDWTAGPFLALYVLLAGGVLLLLLTGRNRLGDSAALDSLDPRVQQLGALHLAYLSGGAECAGSTALVALLEAGAAVPDRKRRLLHFDRSVPVPAEFLAFQHVNLGQSNRNQFQAQFASYWERLHTDLARLGLVPGDAAVARWRWQGAALLCVPLLLGVCKLAVGVSRDRPVGILAMLLIVTVALGAVVLGKRPHRNLAGAAVLAAARRTHARAARAPLPEETALAFALSGIDVLHGRDYRWALAVSASSSGGDGTSGGDGGGGGGGGGGCGGCSA